LIINKGDISWIPVSDETGKIRTIIHPHVVIQDSIINQNSITTIVVCGVSTNLKKVNEPGNILLDKEEANLQKQSIIITSQVSLARKEDFGDFIGLLSEARVTQIFSGMRFIQSFQQ
jgi:mRNA interferase MazF